MHRLRNCNHHHNYRDARVRRTELVSYPSNQSDRGSDNYYLHDNNSHCTEDRSQENGREKHNDKKHDWCEYLDISFRCIGECTIHENIASQIEIEIRIVRACFSDKTIKVISNLKDTFVMVFRHNESDYQSTHTPIARNKISDNINGAECNCFNPL